MSGFRNGAWTGRTYDSSEEWPERTIFTHSISEEESANPVRPPAFSFYGIPPKRGMELPGIIGFPKLAITYAFGLALSPSIARPDDGATTLRTVGSVRAFARVYNVRIAGDAIVDDAPCWHLTLEPLGNPGRYRLRDLWVDKATYQTRRLTTDGNFTGSGAWTVSYKQIGDSWYLSDEMSQLPVHDSTGTFDRVDVAFFSIVTNPHDNLDFGIAGSSSESEIDEPPEAFR